MITSIFHSYGIKACEAKLIKIASKLLSNTENKRINIGSSVDRKFPFYLENYDGEDFNTQPLDLFSRSKDLVICEQVIEHLHNTTWFLTELYRVMSPLGNLLLSTENLASWPNKIALLFGIAPFSCQPICGQYVGGFKDKTQFYNKKLHPSHPSFSGKHGHVRVMTKKQLILLCRSIGFKLKASYGYMGNHYILLHLIK